MKCLCKIVDYEPKILLALTGTTEEENAKQIISNLEIICDKLNQNTKTFLQELGYTNGYRTVKFVGMYKACSIYVRVRHSGIHKTITSSKTFQEIAEMFAHNIDDNMIEDRDYPDGNESFQYVLSFECDNKIYYFYVEHRPTSGEHSYDILVEPYGDTNIEECNKPTPFSVSNILAYLSQNPLRLYYRLKVGSNQYVILDISEHNIVRNKAIIASKI